MGPDPKKTKKKRNQKEELAALMDASKSHEEALSGARRQLRTVVKVVAIFLVVLWGVSTALYSGLSSWVPIYVASAITVAILVSAYLIRRNFQKSEAMGAMLADGNELSKADREARIASLQKGVDKGEAAAVITKAQLEMQESPKDALATLEKLDLAKAQKVIANQVRGMRAMIHLNFGDCSKARELADEIALDKTPDLKSRANLAGVVAEAWSRSGNPIEGGELLDKYDPNEKGFDEIRVQLYRARVFSAVHKNDLAGMKKAMKLLSEISPQLLITFVSGKRIHPLLQQEARRRLEKSGLIPRQRVVGR